MMTALPASCERSASSESLRGTVPHGLLFSTIRACVLVSSSAAHATTRLLLLRDLDADEGDELADVLELLDLGRRELDAECLLGRDDDVDVVEGCPFGDVGGAGLGAQLDRQVVEDVEEDLGQALIDFGLGHDGSPAAMKVGCRVNSLTRRSQRLPGRASSPCASRSAGANPSRPNRSATIPLRAVGRYSPTISRMPPDAARATSSLIIASSTPRPRTRQLISSVSITMRSSPPRASRTPIRPLSPKRSSRRKCITTLAGSAPKARSSASV